MAFKVEKITSPKCPLHGYAVKDYVCDTAADVALLPRFDIEGTQVLGDGMDAIDNEPCHYGSMATVLSPFTGYKLSPSNTWVQIF